MAKFKQQGVKMKKEYIVVKYIRLYFNNTITKCVANAIQISQLFLGVKVVETLRVSICHIQRCIYD